MTIASPPPIRHREVFRVRAAEAGRGAHVKIAALCDWLQEAARRHAEFLSFGRDELAKEGLFWVLSRLTVHVSDLPRLGEVAVVDTWPSGVGRLRALREFRVASPDGATTFAEATSGWLILRNGSRRPVRPPEAVARLAESAPPRALPDLFDDLPDPGPDAISEAFRVRASDLDANDHANNGSIVRWLLDAPAAPPTPPLRLEVDFRGEAFEGTTVAASVGTDSGATLVAIHEVRERREIARARLSRL